jgi:hypothetical protein
VVEGSPTSPIFEGQWAGRGRARASFLAFTKPLFVIDPAALAPVDRVGRISVAASKPKAEARARQARRNSPLSGLG